VLLFIIPIFLRNVKEKCPLLLATGILRKKGFGKKRGRKEE